MRCSPFVSRCLLCGACTACGWFFYDLVVVVDASDRRWAAIAGDTHKFYRVDVARAFAQGNPIIVIFMCESSNRIMTNNSVPTSTLSAQIVRNKVRASAAEIQVGFGMSIDTLTPSVFSKQIPKCQSTEHARRRKRERVELACA